VSGVGHFIFFVCISFPIFQSDVLLLDCGDQIVSGAARDVVRFKPFRETSITPFSSLQVPHAEQPHSKLLPVFTAPVPDLYDLLG
jgi:hypothetical protein